MLFREEKGTNPRIRIRTNLLRDLDPGSRKISFKRDR